MARVSDVTHNNGHRSALPGENSPLALGCAHAAAPSDTRRHDFVRRRREPRQRAGGRLESWYPARRGQRACRGARAVPHRVAGAERSPQGFTDRSGPMVVRGDIGRGTWYFVVDIGAAAGRRQQVRRRGFGMKKAATEAEAEVIADAGRGVVCAPNAGNGWGVPHGAVVASPTGRPAAVDHPRLRQGHPSSDRSVPRRRSTRVARRSHDRTLLRGSACLGRTFGSAALTQDRGKYGRRAFNRVVGCGAARAAVTQSRSCCSAAAATAPGDACVDRGGGDGVPRCDGRRSPVSPLADRSRYRVAAR